MRKPLALLLIALFSLSISGTLAQEDDGLSPGTTRHGTISDDQPTVEFEFQGQQGLTIYATMFATDFDFTPELRLLGPNGVTLEQTDEDMLGTALIGPLTLPADGTYTLVATRPEWEAAGGDFSVTGGSVQMQELQTGVPLEGVLDAPGATTFFTYRGEAEALIGYTTEGEELGVVMLTPGGDAFIYDGHYTSPANPLNFVPESGVYFGMIQTIAEGGTPFRLTVAPVEPEPITAGTPLGGSISDGMAHVFTFDSAAGKLWQLNASFGDAVDGEGWLEIHKPDEPEYYGDALAWDCCSGPGGNPRIEPFIAPADGTYYVAVNFDDYSDDGEPVAFEVALAPSTLVSLAPGTAVSGIVTPDSGTARYAYRGKSGDVIRVTVRKVSGEGAPGLALFSAEDEVILFSGRSARSATFEIELPLDGMYLFEVSNISYDLNDLEFSLLLETG